MCLEGLFSARRLFALSLLFADDRHVGWLQVCNFGGRRHKTVFTTKFGHKNTSVGRLLSQCKVLFRLECLLFSKTSKPCFFISTYLQADVRHKRVNLDCFYAPLLQPHSHASPEVPLYLLHLYTAYLPPCTLPVPAHSHPQMPHTMPAASTVRRWPVSQSTTGCSEPGPASSSSTGVAPHLWSTCLNPQPDSLGPHPPPFSHHQLITHL